RDTARGLFDRFPRLTWVAGVTRDVTSHDSQTLTGGIHRRSGEAATSRGWALSAIVDRVGGGDAFAAGLLHALGEDWPLQQIIDFAAAAGALKHTIPGDLFRLPASSVHRASVGGADIKR
ncbi:MAG: sugar kinase, partial [Proteobacteria bacterium]|nr:sugar kinase [Pseudomonadota bacterium]